jgi:hypothetical protein
MVKEGNGYDGLDGKDHHRSFEVCCASGHPVRHKGLSHRTLPPHLLGTKVTKV